MKHLLFVSILLLSSSGLLTACHGESEGTQDNGADHSVWRTDSMWYQTGQTMTDTQIDLFYLVSTEVISSKTITGETSYLAQLWPEERANMDQEFAFAQKAFCQSDIHCVAPYYHQFTFEALSLPQPTFDSLYQVVSQEVCQAFDHYIKYCNQGRPFALVGFSQGGMLVLDLLRHMTDEQYGQLVAAYAIGYRLSDEDICHPHIRPATGETERGVTISYNSVLSNEAIWPLVSGGAAASINPVNWHNDATPATFTYDDQLHTVTLDTTSYQLIIEVDDPSAYRAWNSNPVFQQMHVHPDCLHHYDLLFYTDCIHDNILKRAAYM